MKKSIAQMSVQQFISFARLSLDRRFTSHDAIRKVRWLETLITTSEKDERQ